MIIEISYVTDLKLIVRAKDLAQRLRCLTGKREVVSSVPGTKKSKPKLNPKPKSNENKTKHQ